MLSRSISIEDVVETLKQWARFDPDAIRKVFETRVPCNEFLKEAGIPTAALMSGGGFPEFHIGVIDLINALFGKGNDSLGAIAMDFERVGGEPRLSGFHLRAAAKAELYQAVPVEAPSAPIGRTELQHIRRRAGLVATSDKCTCMPEWIDLIRAADRLDAMLARDEHEGKNE